MKSSRSILFAPYLIGTVFVFTWPASAATYFVGSCHSGGFTKIMDAVNSSEVAPGSTVLICPGTYHEQVVIRKPLTLIGATTASSTGAAIVGDKAIFQSQAPSAVFGGMISPLVWVDANQVTIENVSLENDRDTAPGVSCELKSPVPALFFQAGSSGTVDHVIATAACGPSVWLEATDSSPASVRISGSYLAALRAGSEQRIANTIPNLDLTLTGNQITAPKSSDLTWLTSAVHLVAARGAVTHNVILGNNLGPTGIGLFDAAPAVLVSNNTFATWGTGIRLMGDFATVQSNTLSLNEDISIGIDFQCHPATVSGNVINGAHYAFALVPGALASNSLFNATNRSDACTH